MARYLSINTNYKTSINFRVLKYNNLFVSQQIVDYGYIYEMLKIVFHKYKNPVGS